MEKYKIISYTKEKDMQYVYFEIKFFEVVTIRYIKVVFYVSDETVSVSFPQAMLCAHDGLYNDYNIFIGNEDGQDFLQVINQFVKKRKDLMDYFNYNQRSDEKHKETHASNANATVMA